MSKLLHFIAELLEEISRLKAEIRLLKGHSAPPTIPPKSRLERKKAQKGEVKKTLFTKGTKKTKLAITSTQRIAATDLPEGNVFKGYKRCIRQKL